MDRFNMNSNNYVIFITIVVCTFLVGCTQFLARDFNKAKSIATIELGSIQKVAGSVILPKGNVGIRFVVRDYDCERPLSSEVRIVFELADGTKIDHLVKFSELTWPKSWQECYPIGYLTPEGVDNTRPLRFVVGRKSNPVRFSISIIKADNFANLVSVWVVYNDRSPFNRMIESLGSE